MIASVSITSLVTLSLVLTLYIIIALVAAWAWGSRDWLLATALTIIFLVATVALIWGFERWGT